MSIMKQELKVHWIYFVVFFSLVSGCPDGWVQFREKCYFFSDFAASFPNAGEYCQISNSKLAEPINDLENTFLKHEVIQKNALFYIGVVDYFVQDEWMYVSNEELVQSSNWRTGEPNSAGKEDCADIEPPTGMWADVRCERQLNFICEKPISEVTDPPILGR